MTYKWSAGEAKVSKGLKCSIALIGHVSMISSVILSLDCATRVGYLYHSTSLVCVMLM